MNMAYVMVGLAGIVGAILRYMLGFAVQSVWTGFFPFATWTANMIGSFLLAFLTASFFRSRKIHPYAVSALGTGLIGSFTTFSTFSVETVQLLRNGKMVIALMYVLLSIAGGLAMAWLGLQTGNKAFRSKEWERER
ncbi:MAG: fluoride efflux transporter CrcB [Ectobacillus sp.]